MTRRDPIQVREYQYLTAKGCGRSDCHPLGAESLRMLREFVLLNRSDDEDDPHELMRLRSLKSVGGAIEAIQLQNYVGVVELADGLQIEILPKIDVSKEGNEQEIFLTMLRTLGSDMSFKSLNSAHLRASRMPMFEVFIGMFLSEAADVVRMGLRSAYIEQRSEERFVRGKIDFAREVKKNPAHAERINVIHDEYMVNRPENRLIKTTLLSLRGISRSNENIRLIRRLLTAFDEIDESHNVNADFARCTNNRGTSMYRNLLSWCRVFLKHESFTPLQGENVAFALLFPMESVFEDYVGKELHRRAIGNGCLERVKLQAQSEYLFETGRGRVRMRPDILCTCHGGRRVVLDAKWKRVKDYNDIKTADMYQMYAYGQRYAIEGEERQHVVLLYPWHEEVARGLYREGRHISKDRVQVDVFFVDLENMEDSMDELLGLIEDPSVLEG